MKDLSDKELKKAPPRIQFLYIAAVNNIPVGASMIEQAMQDHPEYFPDELAYREKIASVPEAVFEDYRKERELLWDEYFKELPKGNGIMYWIKHPAEYKDWSRIYEECKKREAPALKALKAKYFDPYGFEYNGY